MEITGDRLTQELVRAARAAFKSLFNTNEAFYYCALLTTGEGLTPCISAWSKEALEREAADALEAYDLKWSYGDSPYYAWEYERFEPVTRLLAARPSIHALDMDGWRREIAFRMEAMENALRILDGEGLFSQTQNRGEVVVLAQFMPPDASDTQRACRLNQPSNARLQEWLLEAAED